MSHDPNSVHLPPMPLPPELPADDQWCCHTCRRLSEAMSPLPPTGEERS